MEDSKKNNQIEKQDCNEENPLTNEMLDDDPSKSESFCEYDSDKSAEQFPCPSNDQSSSRYFYQCASRASFISARVKNTSNMRPCSEPSTEAIEISPQPENLPNRPKSAFAASCVNDLLNESSDCVDDDQISEYTIRFLRNKEVLTRKLCHIPKRHDDAHKKTHKKLDDLSLVQQPKGAFDEQRIRLLSKPRKIILQDTLENYRNFMSVEKQKRLECELGKTPVAPEKLEKVARNLQNMKLKNRRDRTAELLRQIEHKVSNDVLNEITRKLTGTLAGKILKWRNPAMMSENVKKLNNFIYNLIHSTNGHVMEIELNHNFAGILSDFIVSTMVQSMYESHLTHVKDPLRLKALQNNEIILKVAQSLKRKITVKN